MDVSESDTPRGSLDFESALDGLISVARKEFGETEYIYYRVPHTWRGSRKNGQYFTQITGCPQITKDEYDAKVTEGQANARDAFFGKRKGMSYDTYERKVTRDGWCEILIKTTKEQI